MEKAILVTIRHEKEDKNWSMEDLSAELRELAISSGVEISAELVAKCVEFSPRYLIGKGKVQQIYTIAEEKKSDVVIFNHDLSGTQQRNLEEVLNIKTIDRTQLILDIFAQRAHSKEGKIQVELAQLIYLLPRLIGKGIILSRLGGGIGTRGPGEQKLEVDRRKIRDRITRLKRDLDDATRQREARRKNRERFFTSTIALIGYTNAGKSTLFNALTNAEVYVMDKLFSTLDPTVRRYILPNNQRVIFSDTVGFIHHLPHHLIESFKATLEEVVHADILLHVIDASHPKVLECNEATRDVLRELHIEDKPIINVLNKKDKLKDKIIFSSIKREFKDPIIISALTREGISDLIDRLVTELSSLMIDIRINLSHKDMRKYNIIHEYGKVLKKEFKKDSIYIEARIPIRFKAMVLNSCTDAEPLFMLTN
jgi:GTP-binding protein HflX